MNKMIKGSVAGATGIALLMGGFGTYALWNDSTSLQGSVQAGHMNLALKGAPQWADISDQRTQTAWTADDYMVPGDTVTMTQDFTIDALGKNLGLDLTVDGIETGTWNNLGVSMTLDGTALAGGVARGFAAPNAGNGEHHLVVTFTFNDVSNKVNASESVDLSDFDVTIQQARPSAS